MNESPALRQRTLQLPVRRWTDSPWRAVLLFTVLGWLWFVLCRQLSYEWSANEQYSYGWFVPFFAAFLFWLRWEDRHLACLGGRPSRPGAGDDRAGRPIAESGQKADFPAAAEVKVESRKAKGQRRESPNNRQLTAESRRDASSLSFFLLSTLAFLLLAALLPLRLFEVANPDWRPLSWGHALVVVGYSLLVIGYCFRPAGGPSAESGWQPDFRFNGKAVWHFAFPVCFILVAVPWLTPIEAPLVQGLMRLVASVATETLTLFGIPAQLEGSLIRVNNGVVGVSEACSGVRSLQTSLMIGLLFGELKRLTIARRFVLVGAALAIALFANFGRAFFLVWIAATENLAAVERWHDIAGYAIVGLVFVGTIAIASALAKGRITKDELQSSEGELQGTKDEGRSGIGRGEGLLRDPIPHFAFRVPHFPFLLFTLAFLLLAEASVSAWYRWHERGFVDTPRWTVKWPESAPDFRNLPIDANVQSTLRYDTGREAAWRTSLTTEAAGPPIPASVTMFFFRWEPGSASILRARAHRPDICLPNTGWKTTHDDGVKSYPIGGGLVLPFRHFRFERKGGNGRELYAHAFFCQREDRVPARAANRFDATTGTTGNWMRDDRVRVVREGLRNQGQQVMELVLLTPRRLGPEEAEAEFGRLVATLVKEEGRIKKEETVSESGKRKK